MLALTVIFVPVFANAADKNYDVVVYVNGEQMDFPDQKPYIEPTADRTYVPIRFVSEALGAKVDWNKDSQAVYIKDDQHDISLNIGSYSYLVDSTVKTLDAPPIITGDRTMVPLRFVSEALDREVDYTPWGAFGRVDIYMPGEKPAIPEPKPNVVQLMDQALGGDYMQPYDSMSSKPGRTGQWVYYSDGGIYSYDPIRQGYQGRSIPAEVSIMHDVKKATNEDKANVASIMAVFMPDKTSETMASFDKGINAFSNNTDPYNCQIESDTGNVLTLLAKGDPTGDFVNIAILLN